MSNFKRLETRSFKTTLKPTTDTAYWKRLKFPVTIKEFTSIDSIDVSPIEPHYIAVTSGPKVDVYHQQTAQVWKTLARFKRLAYGAKFRQDGQLILAGTEEGPVKLFNHRQKQLLRIFKAHNGPTHKVDFIHGSPQIVTFSDDKTAILWDIGDEKQVCTLSGHTDFIRAGMVSPASENIILSGSYDHTVKLWDTRTGTSILSVDHGAPVESILSYPSGGVFISAGGNEVRIWDCIGGKLLSKISQHHKTVTCLAFASDYKRLLSGSLDRHVKIYDVGTYSVVHSLKYPAPVLCMAVAPKDSTVITGMISGGSGLISFQHKKPDEEIAMEAQKKAKRHGQVQVDDTRMRIEDHVIEPKERVLLTKYDDHLRRFEYSKALDVVLGNLFTSRKPHLTINVMRELIKRKGVKSAIAGRDCVQLTRLITFLVKNFRHPMYKQTIMDVSNALIDVYEDSLDDNPALVKLFRKLREEVFVEMELTREHMALKGILQTFMTASTTDREIVTSNVTLHNFASTSTSADPLNESPDKKPVDVVEVY